MGVNANRLARAIWEGRVDAPAKAPSGAYLWTAEDIRRASWQLLGRPLDPAAVEARA